MARSSTHTANEHGGPSGVQAQPAPIAPLIGRRLDTLLRQQGLDFERLVQVSGIERAVLAGIARAEIEPTVDLLWRIANALGVQISSLLSPGPAPDFQLVRASETRRFASRDGGFVSRVLSPFAAGAPVEFYGIVLAPGADQHFDAHAPRTTENLVVHSGTVEIAIGREPPRLLEAGDSLYFLADVPHRYRNLGEAPAHIYLVMTYWGLSGD